MTGSHIDSQPTGGKFDGIYGVLAGLEVIRTLNDLDYETNAPIEVSAWTNEEGSRFAPAMVASGVFGGEFELDYALACKDRDGKTIAEELERIGYIGDEEPGKHPVGACSSAWSSPTRQAASMTASSCSMSEMAASGFSLVRTCRFWEGTTALMRWRQRWLCV